MPGSPSRAAGRAAVALPGWASGDTGCQLPLKAAASGVRGRPILTEPGPPLLAGRALVETAAGRAGGESRAVPAKRRPAGRPGSDRCIRACVCSARGATPPTALLCRACLLGRAAPPNDSRSGAVLSRVRKLACTWFTLPSARRTGQIRTCFGEEGASRRRGVRAVRRGMPGRSCPADRV